MIDIKYWLIVSLQFLVKISNKIQKFFFKETTINLKWNEKLLIIKLDRIWDAVWTIYFIKEIKNKYPKIEITVLSNDYNKFVFDENKEIIDNIITLSVLQPYYFIKNFDKILFWIFESIRIVFNNYSLIKKLKNNKYNYILNLTWRKLWLFSKLIWKNIWGWFWTFNFLYNYPIIWHNEIWAENHIVHKRLKLFSINNNSSKTIIKTNYKKVILFIWWKEPWKLFDKTYFIIKKVFVKYWIIVDTISDNTLIQANYYLTKNDTFMVGEVKYKDFLKNYDFFLWIDWGVLHYSSQFIRVVSICATTNYISAYPFDSNISLLKDFPNHKCKIFVTKNFNHYVVTHYLNCAWCFQVWCGKKKCLKSLDIGIEIVIKILTFVVYEQNENTYKINKN